MTDRQFVVSIYPDAKCISSKNLTGNELYAIFCINDGKSLSTKWYLARQSAWYDVSENINRYMMRKLES
jgi:hypothetical protein